MEQKKPKEEPKEEPKEQEKKKPGRKRKATQMIQIVKELVVLSFD
jgi:hypothetical protein